VPHKVLAPSSRVGYLGPVLGSVEYAVAKAFTLGEKHVSQPVGEELAFENIQMQLLHICGSSDLKIAL
jgi:hypothetical protein